MNILVVQIFLSLVQGITDWFPVSSSGNIVFYSYLLHYSPSLDFLAILHLGSLVAAIVYFWNDIWAIAKDFFTFKFKTDNGKMGIYIIITTIPAAIMGALFTKFFENNVNNYSWLVIGFLVTAILLFITSLDFKLKEGEVNMKSSVIIGVAQVASLFRGVSRTATTMCSGILSGVKKEKVRVILF